MLSRHSVRRPPRVGEWSNDKAVTFIVTLAASLNVTLAAARAGMSRKSVYALRRRDPAFALAWERAIDAHRARARGSVIEGVKGNDLHNPPVGPPRGNAFAARARDAALRDSFFAALATRHPDLDAVVLADSAPLA